MRPEYYIWSYEHNAWWGHARLGYTSDLREAGRYELGEARDIVDSANQCGVINEVYVSTDAFERCNK